MLNFMHKKKQELFSLQIYTVEVYAKCEIYP